MKNSLIVILIGFCFVGCDNMKQLKQTEDAMLCAKYYDISTEYILLSTKYIKDKQYSDSLYKVGKYWQRKADSFNIEIKKRAIEE